MDAMLRAVCFDLMGTVLHDPYREALQAATGLGIDELRDRRDPDAWPAFERGEIDEAAFAARFFARGGHGLRFDLEAFNRVRREGYRWLPGMREILDDLAGRTARYAASNYPVWVQELALALDFDACFDAVFASHDLGVRKPDRAFYQRLLEAIEEPAEACLFVDDRPENCAAAAAAGMAAHCFRDAATLRALLVAEGALEPDA